ncbi:MAG: homoserine dehydrogenase [Gammaproteobacteria bacterium]|nr:homoserine dehydrogenase [Gammaproteobacteria bacterium]
MQAPLKIGICGLGTVGGGSLRLLRDNADEIARRAGTALRVVHVATRRPEAAEIDPAIRLDRDPFTVAANPEVQVVVETMGGFDPAFKLVAEALKSGKHVVTANKALIAERGNELFATAAGSGAVLAYESSVAGGIPIIKALREGLAANRIEWLAGIINGTGNFIISEMAAGGRRFEDVLAQAQSLGYAEADPSFDVDGIDAAHKLAIMASIAFGIPLRFADIHTEGIRALTPEDLAYAAELGYRVKHLGIARRGGPVVEKGVDGVGHGVELRVHPTLVSENWLLSRVSGVDNAVVVKGHAVGTTMYQGPGAGADATASAVVADLIDIARQQRAGATQPMLPPLHYHHVGPNKLGETAAAEVPLVAMEDIESACYLRIPALDRMGVMAKITRVLEQHAISIEAVIQKEAQGGAVPIVLLTHAAAEGRINAALAELGKLAEVVDSIGRIRVAPFADGT